MELNKEQQLALLKSQAEELQREIAAERAERAESAHAALVTKCREARDKKNQLRAETDQAQHTFLNTDGMYRDAQRHLSEWKGREPQFGDYPTPAEVAAWEKGLEDRQSTMAKLQAESVQAHNNYRSLQYAWQASAEEFERLSFDESMMRAEVYPTRGGITVQVFDGTPADSISFTARG